MSILAPSSKFSEIVDNWVLKGYSVSKQVDANSFM